jgi:hypothetical protein
MGRKLLGYRVRGTRFGMRVYLNVPKWDWSDAIPLPYANRRECVRAKNATCKEVEVSDVKIVAVYLKTNEYTSLFADERAREDLSDFNRAVVDEIERRNIDAIVEPESFGGMPTTIRFRAPNGDFVWLPIIRYSVVDGPKEDRVERTVDRMLDAIFKVTVAVAEKRIDPKTEDVPVSIPEEEHGHRRSRIEEAISAIESDISDRRGLSGQWDSIDEDVREEIRAEWRRKLGVIFGAER